MRLLHAMGHRVTYAADVRGPTSDIPATPIAPAIPPVPDHAPASANAPEAEGEVAAHVARYVAALRSIGADLMILLPNGGCLHAGPSGSPRSVRWPDALAASGFDTIILMWDDLAARHIPTVRTVLPRSAIVVDSIDLGYLRQRRELAVTPDAYDEQTLQRDKRAELNTYRAADAVITVTEAERLTLLAEVPELRHVVVVPTVHNPVEATAPFATRQGAIFVGNLSYAPNLDAVRWLSADLIGRLRGYLPDAAVTVIGGGMSDDDAQLLARPGLRFAGHVPETAPYLAHARVSLAPLRFGAGIKGKVGEALAHGVPVVATTIAAEGMDLEPGLHALVADAPDDFARSAALLHEDEQLWSTLSAAGRAHVRQRYSDEAVTRQLLDLLDVTAPHSN